MSREIGNCSETDRDLIKNIYRGILDYRYSSIDYYEKIPGHPEASRSDVDRYQKESLRKMHRAIDDAFLDISEATCQKLHRLLIEVDEEKNSNYGYILPARWLRHNKWLEWAKIYYMIEAGYDQFEEEVLHSDEDGDVVENLFSRMATGIEAHKMYGVSGETYYCNLFADKGSAEKYVETRAKHGKPSHLGEYTGTELFSDGNYAEMCFSVNPTQHKHVFANKDEAEQYLEENSLDSEVLFADEVTSAQTGDKLIVYYIWEDDFDQKFFRTQKEAIDYLHKNCGQNVEFYYVDFIANPKMCFDDKAMALEHAEKYGLSDKDIDIEFEEVIDNAEIDEIDIFRHEYALTLQQILKEDFPELFSK